jgi:hypothetical protein
VADFKPTTISKKRKDICGLKPAGTRWTVLGRDDEESKLRGHTYWKCECVCGVIKSVYMNSLLSGKSKSCGCHSREVNRSARLTHGQSRRRNKSEQSVEYRTWEQMTSRCVRESKGSKNHFGRGIVICVGLRDFLAFLSIIGKRPGKGFSIDRINNDGHYSCGRCPQCEENWWQMNLRWATARQQALNRRKRTRLNPCALESDRFKINESYQQRIRGPPLR